ncbi:MAG: nickel pincer cofactor biosynthesis protein LarC [Coriobacteriia bacterium]|nr:nickel pincer cofactor biosynthesis protein LarC [Coriobacteriia bacterium]
MSTETTTDTQTPQILAHLDCSTGVSGDKFLGALIEAGSQLGQFSAADLQNAITQVAPEAVVSITKTSSYGISATSVSITSQTLEPHSRSFKDIRKLINTADLPSPVKTNAIDVFTRLAEAEGLVHGVATEEVTFHEVGALDSIGDVVGVCAGIDALGIQALYATPPALGSGTVTTAHGEIPVPAPATAALLLGKPTTVSSASGELTTPTGAALLHLAAGFGPVPPMTPILLGYGAGTKDIGQANICRLIVGEAATKATHGTAAPTTLTPDTTVLLETNIDHITPEAVAFAGEELVAEGALDVWITPIAMKKGRAALTLSVLVSPTEAEMFAERIVALTGTLGVRVIVQPRLIAHRETVDVDTEWGTITLKHGAGRYRPEHEDIARIARENNLLYHDVLVKISNLTESI